MRCARGLRKSMRVAFSGAIPPSSTCEHRAEHGDSDRISQALVLSGPGARPRGSNLSDRKRRHKRSRGVSRAKSKIVKRPTAWFGILGSVFSGSAAVFVESHVHHPMKIVFDAPDPRRRGARRRPGRDCHLRSTICRSASTPSTARGPPGAEAPPKFSNSASAVLRRLRRMIHSSRACGPRLVGVRNVGWRP